MLFFLMLFGIIVFIVFSGVVGMAILDPEKGIDKDAGAVGCAVVGMVVLAFAIASLWYVVLLV